MIKKASCLVVLAILAAGAAGPGGFMKKNPSADQSKETPAELWKKVEAADRDGLPQTAIDLLKKIYASPSRASGPARP